VALAASGQAKQPRSVESEAGDRRAGHLTLAETPLWFPGDDSATVPLLSIDAALLAWLALEGPTSRARVAQLLWPDKDAEAARNSLRQRLFQLKRQLGTELVTGSSTLSLAAGVTHDLEEADGVLGETAGETLAPGEFAQWLALQRERRSQRVRRSHRELCEMAEGACDWDDALTHARELLALEPLSEEAHRRLMRLHYLHGDRAAALLAFDRCERVLKDDVGASPSAETLALLGTINAAAPAAAALQPDVLPAGVLLPPRLIGRDAELVQMQQAWSTGQVLALIGEAGLGKTRLLQAFMEARHGVVRAAGRPGDAGVPFATLARLLRAVMAHGDAPRSAETALPAATRTELARVLPEFEAPSTRHTGEGQRLVMQRAIGSLLETRTALEGLVVDDLHFADEASLEMLRSLIDADGDAPPLAARPLRWALAYRAAEAGSPVRALHDALAEQARIAPIVLAPLDAPALAALVDSLALPGVDGKALAPGLLRRTGGNPLFVLETLKQAWVERTLGKLADAAALPRPVSVGRLIERRVAQLSPGALALTRVASIAGVDFGIQMAEDVLGASAMQFVDALNELEAAQVMRGTQFAHDLVFDAVKASVPASIAQHTHGKVAQWLEEHDGEPARVAGHWIAAAQPVRALPWLGHAANAAGTAFRSKEQIAFLLQKAAIEEAANDRDAAFATLMHAAEHQVTIDDETGAGLALCDRLDALATNTEQRVRAMAQRAHWASLRGDLSGAERLAAGALREGLRGGVGQAVIIECRQQLATAFTLQDRSVEAIAQFEASIGWVDEHGDDGARCELHANLAIAYDNASRLSDSPPHHEMGIKLAQRMGHQSNLAMCLNNYAANRILGGHLADGQRLLERGRLVRSQAEDLSSVDGFGAMLQAVCDYQSGRYRAALSTLDASLANLGQFAPGFQRLAMMHLAVCWACLGQWARLQRLLADLGDPAQWKIATRIRVAIVKHQMELGLGRRPTAQALVDVLEQMGAGELPDMRQALEIEIASLQEPEEGLRQLQAVIAMASDLGLEGNVIAAHARAARLAARTRHVEQAHSHAHAALELADRSQMVRQYPGELWLDCGAALAEVDDLQSAAAIIGRGAAWVRSVAADQVPDEFRNSFLQRNPVNRELLALAARLGSG